MRRSVCVAFDRDGGYRNDGHFGEAFFQLDISRLAVGETQPPAIVMDGDVDVIGIVERSGTASKRRVVKIPFRRGELPNQLRKIVPIPVIAGSAALRGEIILV